MGVYGVTYAPWTCGWNLAVLRSLCSGLPGHLELDASECCCNAPWCWAKDRGGTEPERKMRPCVRSWLPVTYTLRLYIHFSLELAWTFHAAFGYPDDYTTGDHHPTPDEQTNLLGAGDDKNYYRARSSSLAVYQRLRVSQPRTRVTTKIITPEYTFLTTTRARGKKRSYSCS